MTHSVPGRVPPSTRSALRTVFALTAGPLIGLGLARFAYSLLLPSMRLDLHWNYAVAGLLGTANAVGYLGGAIVAAPLARRFGSRATFIASIVVVIVGLFATAAADALWLLIALRVLVGIAGATGFIVGGGLAAETGRGHSRSFATMLLAVYFAGGGLGIIASGIAVPLVLAPADDWRLGWLVLGAVALVVFAVAVRGILRAPEVEARSAAAARWPVRSIGVAMLSYFVYGAGYISYMTFVVALIGSRGASNAEIGWFWVTLGLASIATTFFWGRAIARLGGRWGTATILGITTIGAIIPVLTDSIWAAFASAIIFGGSFLNVVTGVTSVARDVLEPRHWTAAIGALTVAFAAGQCIGPILTGAIADSHNGISVGLAVSAGLLGIAALTALAQRVPETPTIE